jgi:hypothetical protein
MQTQPPVPPVSSTRNSVAPAGTRSSNNGGYVIAPCVAPAGLHASTVGTSTKDKPDRVVEAEAVESFNRELQRAVSSVDWSQPF